MVVQRRRFGWAPSALALRGSESTSPVAIWFWAGGGIRTLGRLTAKHLSGARIRPLCHASVAQSTPQANLCTGIAGRSAAAEGSVSYHRPLADNHSGAPPVLLPGVYRAIRSHLWAGLVPSGGRRGCPQV